MLSKFIAGIIAFLLTFFPNSLFLQASYQSHTFDRGATAHAVVDAIETRNVEALADMMCKSIKTGEPDLPGEIQRLYNIIDNANIDDETEITWEWMGSYNKSDGTGKRIAQTYLVIFFPSVGGDYLLNFCWETVNNFAPDERGIRFVSFAFRGPIPTGMYDFCLRAAKGVGEWHD